jgi:lactate racemase
MVLVGEGTRDAVVAPAAIREIVRAGLRPILSGQPARILGIIPDKTRSFTPGVVHAFVEACRDSGADCDLLIANGTHAPMTDEEIARFLHLDEVPEIFEDVTVYNHTTKASDLCVVDTIPADVVCRLSSGRLNLDIPVKINRRVFDYDALVIIGPVFPHEVVGMSGGYKYLYPGIAGLEIIDQSHWLGALMGIHDIIGRSETPVRRLIEYAGEILRSRRPVLCLSLVLASDHGLRGLWCGEPIESHRKAAALSREVNIVWADRRYRRVVAECPLKYDELWTAGKLAYKTQEVVKQGGEIVLYAPQLRLITPQHPDVERVGYHCLDYFVGQWDRFKDCEPSSLAHSTHVAGPGTYKNGKEVLAAERILASAHIGPERCASVNLTYMAPDKISFDRHLPYGDDGDTLWVPQAGEQLFMAQEMRAALESA